MHNAEFDKLLTHITAKRKFESITHYGFILFISVLFILQIKGLLLSTYGVATILIINIINIINISSRSTSLNQSMSTFYQLRLSSVEQKNGPAINLSEDMNRDIGQPLQKEIKINMNLLYSVGVIAVICSVIVLTDALSGQFHIYNFDQWVNNAVYYGYFLVLIILYRVMFLSDKRYGKVQMHFIEYIQKIERMRVLKEN